jgi:undecaprenyl-phosphate galactose phosphotransferase
VKPGITGLWQVSGRSEIKYSERVKLDYLYMLNWSNWLDFVIVLKTFAVIITGKGAY